MGLIRKIEEVRRNEVVVLRHSSEVKGRLEVDRRSIVVWEKED